MNPKEIVAKNLQKLLDRKGVTQTQMANHLGYPEMTVSNWIKAKTYPRVDKMQEMADYFGVRRSDIEELKNENLVMTNSQYIHLPTAISAGLPFEIDGVTNYDTISIPDEFMGKYAGHKDIIISKINGDSMDKLMHDGSFIAIKPLSSVDSLNNGDMVVFSHNHEYSVKYFYKHDDTLIFKPYSDNPVHYDQSFNIDDGVVIHGKVVTYIVNLD